MRFKRWAAFAVLALAGAFFTPMATLANNVGSKTIPFRITNNTGLTQNIYVYVIGLVPQRGNKAHYLSNVNGDVTIVPEAKTPRSLALNLGNDRVLDLHLPQLTAARIYISVGKPVVVTNFGAPGAPPSSPPGWVKTDPNFNTVFDFAEYTWLDDPAISKFHSTFGGNLTQVDFFSIPMFMELHAADDNNRPVLRQSGFRGSTVRANVFAGVKNAGAPWNKLIVAPTRVPPIRILAPYKAEELGVWPAGQLDPYINQVWTRYTDNELLAKATAEGVAVTFRGHSVGNAIVFLQTNGPETFQILKPDSNTVYRNEIKSDKEGHDPASLRARAVAASMGGAFLRTNLLVNNNLNACDTTQFFRNQPINWYGRVLHQYAFEKKAYAFGYDDTCDQSSFVQGHDPQRLDLTLGKF
jgi:hypothetical protein